MIWSTETVLDRNMTGAQVYQIRRNEEGADPAWTTLFQNDRCFGNSGQPARSGSDQYACSFLVFFAFSHPARINNGLLGCGDCTDNEPVHLAPVFA